MSHTVTTETTNMPSTAAFWACAIFIGLLIGAINFAKPSGDHGAAHGSAHGTEHVDETHAPAVGDAHHHSNEEAAPAH